jgi:hypothetical protein
MHHVNSLATSSLLGGEEREREASVWSMNLADADSEAKKETAACCFFPFRDSSQNDHGAPGGESNSLSLYVSRKAKKKELYNPGNRNDEGRPNKSTGAQIEGSSYSYLAGRPVTDDGPTNPNTTHTQASNHHGMEILSGSMPFRAFLITEFIMTQSYTLPAVHTNTKLLVYYKKIE